MFLPLQYMRSFEAAASSSQPLISVEAINTIFYKIPDLHKLHTRFIHDLEPLVEHWHGNQEVAAVFKMLVSAWIIVSHNRHRNDVVCLSVCSLQSLFLRLH